MHTTAYFCWYMLHWAKKILCFLKPLFVTPGQLRVIVSENISQQFYFKHFSLQTLLVHFSWNYLYSEALRTFTKQRLETKARNKRVFPAPWGGTLDWSGYYCITPIYYSGISLVLQEESLPRGGTTWSSRSMWGDTRFSKNINVSSILYLEM